MVSKKHINVWNVLNYIKQLFHTRCVSISVLAPLVDAPIDIPTLVTAEIKNYKSMVKKKRKKAWQNFIVIKN